jgi:hypothetical protein
MLQQDMFFSVEDDTKNPMFEYKILDIYINIFVGRKKLV